VAHAQIDRVAFRSAFDLPRSARAGFGSLHGKRSRTRVFGPLELPLVRPTHTGATLLGRLRMRGQSRRRDRASLGRPGWSSSPRRSFAFSAPRTRRTSPGDGRVQGQAHPRERPPRPDRFQPTALRQPGQPVPSHPAAHLDLLGERRQSREPRRDLAFQRVAPPQWRRSRRAEREAFACALLDRAVVPTQAESPQQPPCSLSPVFALEGEGRILSPSTITGDADLDGERPPAPSPRLQL
jgi:hypothetical protein